MFLVFDTETTGLPSRKSYDNYFSPEQLDKYEKSRIVSIAWILCDGPKIVSKQYHVVKPSDFVIDDKSKATEIHGITQKIALEQGSPLPSILNAFYLDISRCSGIVAHNLAFDKHIILSELYRCVSKDVYNKETCEKIITKIKNSTGVCTMKKSCPHLNLLNKYGRPKYPKLDELHTHFFGEPVKNAHNAMADTEACYRCFLAIPKNW